MKDVLIKIEYYYYKMEYTTNINDYCLIYQYII